MAPSQRRCSTCRHFQPAPLWRKGWCRNPVLYASHQNHLVDERDLDCDRPFGDYWEPAELAAVAAPSALAAASAASAPAGSPTAEQPAPDPSRPVVDPMTVVRPSRPATPPLRPPVATAPTAAPGRSHGDELRLALPVAAILLLLGGYAAWTGLLLRSAATSLPPTPIVQPTSPPAVEPTLAPTLAPVVTPAPSPTSPPPTSSPTPPPPTPTPDGLRAGAAAIVDTEGLRLRRDPGRSGAIIRPLRPGERLVLLEGPRDEDGQAWWKVEVGGTNGWVAAAFIRPAP